MDLRVNISSISEVVGFLLMVGCARDRVTYLHERLEALLGAEYVSEPAMAAMSEKVEAAVASAQIKLVALDHGGDA